MKILVDTHTHTVLSGHAYSTLLENIHYAAKTGMEGIVNTDHGPDILGASPEWGLSVLWTLPDEIEGVRIYRGVEANILDYSGKIDVTPWGLSRTEFVVSSLHDVVIKPGCAEENLAAYVGALKNPYVDVLGHVGTPSYDFDKEELVIAAKNENKLLEVNNHSFCFRPGSEGNCHKIIELCKKHDVRITVSSDAHFCMGVGAFEYSLKALQENDFPEELIINRTRKTMDEYLNERKKRLEKNK